MAALPDAEIFAASTEANICHDRNPQICLVPADTAVRHYAEDLERVARRWTARGGLQRNPVESIVDTDNRNDIQAQKNDACSASSFRVYQHSLRG